MLEQMRILVVEDDKKIASFIVNGLKQSGFAVDHAAEGVVGDRTADRQTEPDLARIGGETGPAQRLGRDDLPVDEEPGSPFVRRGSQPEAPAE